MSRNYRTRNGLYILNVNFNFYTQITPSLELKLAGKITSWVN